MAFEVVVRVTQPPTEHLILAPPCRLVARRDAEQQSEIAMDIGWHDAHDIVAVESEPMHLGAIARAIA